MFAVTFFARTCLCESLEKSQKSNPAKISCHTEGFAHRSIVSNTNFHCTYSIKTKILSMICLGISEKRKN